MIDQRWERLLTEMRAAHEIPALSSFCDFPTSPETQKIDAYGIPAAALFQSDTGLLTERFAGFRDALLDAAPLAHWRETYKDTDIGTDFLDKFGCYEVLGRDAPFASNSMRSFMLYQPAGLHYPWHHHPAEELYLILAGEAEFAIHGQPSNTLCPGDTVFHESNVPHAMTTHDHPILAYVLWRGDLGTKPIWTPEDMLH
ncbi:MAG: dimethylsulfonioproprionate lyase family protein [Pseudomonadota bacterium]